MKKSEYLRSEIPSGVSDIVRAVCADYDRRAAMLKWSDIEGDVMRRYTELNGIIDMALEEVEGGIRRKLLEDVILGRGYHFSSVSPYLAKNTYYMRKRKFVYDVAVGLGLME